MAHDNNPIEHRIVWIVAALCALLTGCLVETTECDENRQCKGSKRCFRSRVVEGSGGYCQKTCANNQDCNGSEICIDCPDGNCLDDKEGKVCAPCVCDPACSGESGCLDGICSDTVTGCLCGGNTCT